MSASDTPRRRPRSLALEVVEALAERIREGRLTQGDKLPTETAIMGEFSVSRTVVREAISRLQASGLVETRHGVGTFVLGLGEEQGFRIGPEQMATLRDVIAVLELRLGIETEACALAAQRRNTEDITALREALRTLQRAVEAGEDSAAADFQFHLAIARATHNERYVDLMSSLGRTLIPRARLVGESISESTPQLQQYLRRVNTEHENICEAIANGDPDAARAAMRTHLVNGRERRRRLADSSGSA